MSVAGYASGSFVTVDVLDMVLRNYSVVGVYAGGTTPEEDVEAYHTLLGMAERGVIRTPVGTVSLSTRQRAGTPGVRADDPHLVLLGSDG